MESPVLWNNKTLRRSVKEALCTLTLLSVSCLFFIKHWHRLFRRKQQKSVYFFGNNYCTFYNLAEGLKKLGWRAISVNPDKRCLLAPFYHSLLDTLSEKDSINVFLDILFNYKFLHLYNRTSDSLYIGSSLILKNILSIKNLRKFGVIVIFTPSGCLDGSTSKEINALTNGLCEKCIWQGNFCNDSKNQARNNWILKNCDLFSNEVDLPKELARSPIGISVPLSPLNSKIWFPDLIVPAHYKIFKKENELIVFTAFGNEHLRTNEARDIKGKRHIINAINQLINEGYAIKHFHAEGIASENMKYYQVQADIIIDQLNYGSIGSAAKEGMMLGRLVICYIAKLIRSSNIAMRDCPAIDATEETIYDVLKKVILLSQEERLKIGVESRKWMMKWFDVDVCVKRYEKITNCLLHELPFQPQEKFL